MVTQTLKIVAIAALLMATSNAQAFQDCGGCSTHNRVDSMRNCGRGISQYEAAVMWASYCRDDCSFEENAGCGNATGRCGGRLHGLFHRSACDGCGLRGGRHRSGCGFFAGGSCVVDTGCGDADPCGTATTGGGLLKGHFHRGCGLFNHGGCGLFNQGGCGDAVAATPACDTGCGEALDGCGCKLGFFKRHRSGCGRTCKLRQHRLLSSCNQSCFADDACQSSCDSGCRVGLLARIRNLLGIFKCNKGCSSDCHHACDDGCSCNACNQCDELASCGKSCGLFHRLTGKFGKGGCMKSCVGGRLTGACGCNTSNPCTTHGVAEENGNTIIHAAEEAAAHAE